MLPTPASPRPMLPLPAQVEAAVTENPLRQPTETRMAEKSSQPDVPTKVLSVVALALETFPWLNIGEDAVRATKNTSYMPANEALVVPPRPGRAAPVLLRPRRVLAAIEIDHEYEPPAPQWLSADTWTDFVGWFAAMKEAYGKFRDAHPLSVVWLTAGGNTIFKVNLATREGPEGLPAPLKSGLWGWVRLNRIRPATSEESEDDGNG